MLIEDAEQLSGWLTKELQPICDADPASLAKYVIALIRKPDKTDDQLKAFCLDQLDAFLQQSTSKFVDKLFVVLGEKSYLAQKKTDVVKSAPTPVVEEKTKEREKDDKEKDRKGKENVVIKSEPKDNDRRREQRESPRRERSSRTSERPPAAIANENAPGVRDPVRETRDVRERDVKREREIRDEPSMANAATSDHSIGQRIVRKRISPPPTDKIEKPVERRRRSRSPRGERRGGRRRSAERDTRRRRSSRSRSDDRDREREHRDRKRRARCRDFDEKGYCMRGDQCQFDHGPDPVVVDDHALEKIVKMPKGSASSGPNFSLPPPGYNPLTQPPPPGVVAEGGYNPEAPSLSTGMDFSVPPPNLLAQSVWRPPPPSGGFNMVPSVPIPYDPSASIPIDPSSNDSSIGPMRGMNRGRGRGRGMRGRTPYSHPSTRNDTGKSLEVRKIPPEFNNISKLNEHFAQFGSIVNMQVHFEGDSDAALVTYSSRGEASNAYKSTQPILNNRFIKVFWHNPPTPQTQQMDEAMTSVSSDGSLQRTVLNSGVTVDRPPAQDYSAPYVPQRKPPQEVASRAQSIFRNPAMEEEMAKRNAEREQRRMEKKQQAHLLEMSKAKLELISKLITQQRTAMELVKRAQDDATKQKSSKVLSVILKKLETERKEMKEISAKLEEINNKQNEEKEARAAKGEEPVRDTPSPEEEKKGDEESVDKQTLDTVLLVSGFDAQKEAELTAFLSEQCGMVVSLTILSDGDSGSALVTFENSEAVEKALSQSGMSFMDQSLTFSRPPGGVSVPFEETRQPTPNAEDLLANLGNSEESDED